MKLDTSNVNAWQQCQRPSWPDAVVQRASGIKQFERGSWFSVADAHLRLTAGYESLLDAR